MADNKKTQQTAQGAGLQGNAGLVGAVNPTAGISNLVGDISLDLGLDNFNAANSSASSSATASLARGDNNVSSGSSSAGKIGLVKGLIFGGFLLVGFFIFEKWGKK